MSHITNYRRLFSPSSNLRRLSGNTEPANYIAYDVAWQLDKGPEAVVPHYFEIPRSSEAMVREMIAQAYDDMDHQLLCIDEKVTTVFRPVIDVDGIPWGTPRETVLEFVRSLISYAYKNIFAYPKRERRWSRRVMVLTSNPFHRQRHFPYHGNTEDCEAYFTQVKKDGFGLHIAFCEEKVLREQYRAIAFNLKTLCPGDFSAKIDLFDTQLTKDGLMKLRMPLCDNGRKGFPLKPYVPMGYYQINVDTDEDSFAVETLEDSLYAEMVMDNCHMRLESVDVTKLRDARRPNSLCFIENSKYITSVFTDNFYAWFASMFNEGFITSMSRLARCCLPITGTRLGYISMESCASDMDMVVNSILRKIKISNSAIENRIANEQSLAQCDTAALIKECIDALNEVVFWVSSKQAYYYIVKNSNLRGRKELKSFTKNANPNFGILVDVYELCEPVTRVRGNIVTTMAPKSYTYQDWSVKCWKKTPFINLWKPKHVVVSDVIFDPSVAVGPGEKVQMAKEEDRVVINTFPGFKVSVDVLQETWRMIQEDPARMECLKKFRNFIRYCVIGGNIPSDFVDDESLEYLAALERYYKQLLVAPHRRTMVVLSIKGEAGYGKSYILGEWMKYVYGEFSTLCVTSSDPSILFGTFTFPDMDKMLYIYVDEAKLNRDPKERAKVKQMVTGKTSGFNEKNRDQFVSELYFNLVTSANNMDNIKVDIGDRRMLCFTTWNSNRNDPRVELYFIDPKTGREMPTVDAYLKYVEKKGIFKDWLCYLACRDHYPEVCDPDYNFQASIPKTHTYQQAISVSFDDYNLYWYTALMKRSCTSPRNTLTAAPIGGLTVTRQKKMVRSEKAWDEIVQNYIDSDVKFSEMWNNMIPSQKVTYRNDPHAFKSKKIKEMLLHQEYMTLEESRHYYDHCLSGMEKDGYRDFLKATGTNDSPTDEDTFQYFTGVYNEHNREWPRWLPLGVVREEITMAKGGKSSFRYNQQVLVESIARNVGANEAEFAANAVSSTLLEIPDWLTCQKKFALRNRYSFNFIKTLCARAGNNINGRRSDLVIAPWPDTYYRGTNVSSFEGDEEEAVEITDSRSPETSSRDSWTEGRGGGALGAKNHGEVRKIQARDEEEEITSSLEELFFSPDFGEGSKGKEPFDEEEEDRPPLTKLRRFADEEEL